MDTKGSFGANEREGEGGEGTQKGTQKGTKKGRRSLRKGTKRGRRGESDEQLAEGMETLDALESKLLVDVKLEATPALRKEFPSPDLLILVVNEHELQAALRFVTLRSLISLESRSYYYGWWIWDSDVSVVLVQQSSQGSSGVGKAHSVIAHAVRTWQPRLVCGIGVAFGYDKTKHCLMDVLVSQLILPYAWVREGEITTENRNLPLVVSPKVLNLFQSSVGSASSWQLAKSHTDQGTIWCKAHQGALFCGDALVDSSQFKGKLESLFALGKKKRFHGVDVVGGEMEGVGIFAPCQELSIPCIVVKGVCDFGEGKSQLHQGVRKAAIQRKAAFAAFSLMNHVLVTQGRAALPPPFKPVSSAQFDLPTTWTTVDSSYDSYAACVQLLRQQELYDSAQAAENARIAEKMKDADFSQSLAQAEQELTQAEAHYQQVQKRYEELCSQIEPAPLDDGDLQKSREELAAAKWGFASSWLKIMAGDTLLGTIKRMAKKSRIQWSEKNIKPYVSSATLNKMREELRPEPKVSFDIRVESHVHAESDAVKRPVKQDRDSKKGKKRRKRKTP